LGAVAMILPFPLAAFIGIRSWLRLRKSEAEAAAAPPPPPPEPVPGVPAQPPREPMRPADPLLVVAFAGLWIVISFFPVSHLPVPLPAVRAWRCWYCPVIGTSLILGVLFGYLADRAMKAGALRDRAIRVLAGAVVVFFLFQGIQARRHANDYADDLTFW